MTPLLLLIAQVGAAAVQHSDAVVLVLSGGNLVGLITTGFAGLRAFGRLEGQVCARLDALSQRVERLERTQDSQQLVRK